MNCNKCIHENLCVIKAFPDMFENTQWYDGEKCKIFREKKGFPIRRRKIKQGSEADERDANNGKRVFEKDRR